MRVSEAAASAVFSLLRIQRRGTASTLLKKGSRSCNAGGFEHAVQFASPFSSSASASLPLPGGPGLREFLPPPKKRPVPPPPPRQAIPGVAHIVAVSSGKGGVGKSTVAGKQEEQFERERGRSRDTSVFILLNLVSLHAQKTSQSTSPSPCPARASAPPSSTQTSTGPRSRASSASPTGGPKWTPSPGKSSLCKAPAASGRSRWATW